jgi:hypothetical protein
MRYMETYGRRRPDSMHDRAREWRTFGVITPAARNGPARITVRPLAAELLRTCVGLAVSCSDTPTALRPEFLAREAAEGRE